MNFGTRISTLASMGQCAAAYAALGTFLLATGVAGCNSPELEEQVAVGRHAAALTLTDENARVLGFENANDWSNDAGLSSQKTEGSSSLAVAVSGWTEVTSIPLSTLGAVADNLSIDVLLPAATTWGEVRVVLKVPSQGEHYRDLGGVPLADRGAGSFHTLGFSIPADLQAKLAQSYSDLTVTVIVNGPSGQYLLDRLFVGQDASVPPGGGGGPSGPTLALSLPQGVSLEQVVLGATNGLGVADRVQVSPPASTVTNAGAVETNIGVDAHVGNVVSAAPLTLRDRAVVHGNVTTDEPVTYQNEETITVDGAIVEDATLGPPTSVTRVLEFPPAAPGIHLEPNQPPLSIAPGSYGPVEVKQGSQINLSAGEYYFDSLAIHPGARLSITSGDQAVLVYVRTFFDFKGIYELTGSPADVFFGVLGSGQVSLEAPLSATLVAPNASLRFAPLNPGEFAGSFFADSIYQAEPGLTITHVPFRHWGRVFGPVPKAECVTVQNAVTRSARFTYENQLETSTIVPHGPRNHVTPTPPPGFEPPTEFLPGVHSYWVAFEGDEVVWQLDVFRAVATLDLPRCELDDFPTTLRDPDLPVDSISVSRPNSVVLADSIPDRPPVTEFPPIGSQPVSALGFTGTVPFTLQLTELRPRPDGAFASLDVDALVTLDGVTRERDLWDCGGIGEGCIIGPIPIDERFTIEPANPDLVSVRIRIIERDTFGDDVEVDVSFTVNPKTGEMNRDSKCALAGDGWGVCWDFFTTQPPPAADFRPVICATFAANFFDSGFGEDHLPGRLLQHVPASFARAELRTSWDGATVWSGYLDANGCIPVHPETDHVLASALAFPASSSDAEVRLAFEPRFCRAPDGVAFADPPNDDSECLAAGGILWNVIEVTSGFSAVLQNDVLVPGVTNVSAKATRIPTFSAVLPRLPAVQGWVFPLHVNNLADQSAAGGGPRLDDVSRVAAASTQILRTDDAGIVAGRYEVIANDACPSRHPDIVGDACVTGGVLWMGPGKLGFTDENLRQTRWKYVLAHEAGHLIQQRAIGSPGSTGYEFSNIPPGCPPSNQVTNASGNVVCADPPGTDALCRCDHVEQSNKLHCLQSLETPGSAQLEGFGQFYASKIWNRRAEPDCTFVYYKEFLDQQCRSAECSTVTPAQPSRFDSLQRSIPPVAVSCATPPRWRNNFCAVATLGTEIDWMAFFWRLHGGSGVTLSMADINDVYLRACLAECAQRPTAPGCMLGRCVNDQAWDELETAATEAFGLGSPKQQHFANSGLAAGVSLAIP